MITAKSTSQTTDKYDHLFRIIVFGEQLSGKTSLMNRFVHNKFSTCTIPRLSPDYFSKILDILGNDQIIKCKFWNMLGHQRFVSIMQGHYRGSNGAIFVYDISSRDTFNELQFWLDEFRTSILTQTVFLLIGTKTDLTTERQVSFDKGQRFAEENQMLFFECSAKTGENVDRAFTEICFKIYQQQSIKEAVSFKNEINNAQNKNTSFFNWFNGSKKAKPKPISKEIKEKEAITIEKDEKIEEETINDKIKNDDMIQKNNTIIEDKMKELIKTTEQTIAEMHEDLDRKNYRLEEKMNILINFRDSIIEKIRVDMDKKMEIIKSQMNIFINDLKEKDVKTDEYNETVDVRMNNVMNELKDLHVRICGNKDKMDERINHIINDINERDVKIYEYIASIEHEIKELNKTMEKFREDMSFLQQLKELANPLNQSKNPIFMSGEISFIVEDIFAKKAKYEIIDSKCFYGLKEPCKMSVRIHTNDHFEENSLGLYLMVWHDELTDQVKWPMSATVDVRLKINKLLEGLSYNLKIKKPFDNSYRRHNLSCLSYGTIFDGNISSENRLTINVKVV